MSQEYQNYKLIKDFVSSAERELCQVFFERANQFESKMKNILEIYQEERICSQHFQSSTGIGHEDISREKIDKIFAKLFKAETAAVRMQFVSGTHAISSVLFGILRPGDCMISLTGKPYDTLEEVIGLRGQGQGSLLEFGVEYKEIDIFNSFSSLNYGQIESFLKKSKCKLVFIQKSCGYTWRHSLTNKQISKLCKLVHEIHPQCICFIDNCYGELVEDTEPIIHGANIIAGSLIKNLGGTIVPTGGYVAGDAKLVELACCRLTTPGIGSRAGINFGLGRLIFQGLFLSPQMINQALNSADLVALIFQKIGFEVLPKPGTYRSDIIQAIQLKKPELVKLVCQSFQNSSPVDSFLNVVPSPITGYESNLLMSGGTFVEGSTSEFTADAPLRDPYNIFVQGGSHISHVKIALIQLLSDLLKANLIEKEILLKNQNL